MTGERATDWLGKRAQLSPGRVAIEEVDSGNETTYWDWNQQVNQTAHFLDSCGLGKGDLVSTLASNSKEYIDLFFACTKTGTVLHNLNWRLSVHELIEIMREAQSNILFYSSDWQNQAHALQSEFPELRLVLLSKNGDKDVSSFGHRETMPKEYDQKPIKLSDPWGIYYTGGTTGTPKGAILTHGNMFWNSVNTITSWNMCHEDVAPLQLPFFHVGGPNIFLLPLVHLGGKTLLAKEFSVDQTFDMIENGHLTHYVGVPTMYVMLQNHSRWNQADFSKLKLVISGGAPCPLPVMKKFWDRGVDFKMGYGLTEASGNNFWLPPGEAAEKIGSVGFPLFHIDMKVVDEEGRTCQANQEGQLLIRGGHVTSGYYKRPKATSEILQDGWLHTGDIARKDEHGYFYIMGRSKEMFISGGENVYPAEIESALHAHPNIAEAALIAIPHPTWGEVGKAFIVKTNGAQLDENQVLEFLHARLAKYKIPKEVVFLEALPKTAIGKLDKKQLPV